VTIASAPFLRYDANLTVGRWTYLTPLEVCSFARLFAKLPQPGDSKVTFAVFESNCQLLPPNQPLKGRDNLVKCLAQGHNQQLADLSSNYPFFNAERPARKL